MSNGSVIRQNVDNLSAQNLASLRDGYGQMQAIADNRSFNFLSGLHGIPSFYCQHHRPLFLPWHRAYLYTFEQNLRDRVASASIPWWDWTSDVSHQTGVPAAFSDAKDAAGTANPLLKSRINVPTSNPPVVRDTQRFPGSPGDLPQQADVDDALARPDFLDFSAALENIHDAIHGWTGGMNGDMGMIPTAAFDPIFYSHHCMIDRIWYLWQIRNGQNNLPSSLLGRSLVPFGMRTADVLDITQLGYDYAVSQVTG